MGELTGADWNRANRAYRAQLGPIECVPTASGLVMDDGQVRVDRQAGMGMCLEALQLGVVRVAARLAAKNGLGEQCLAPERDQPLGIQILGMQ